MRASSISSKLVKIKALGFPLMAIYTIHHKLFHFPISPYFNKTFCSTHALDQRECGKHMRGQESPGFCPRPPANRRPRPASQPISSEAAAVDQYTSRKKRLIWKDCDRNQIGFLFLLKVAKIFLTKPRKHNKSWLIFHKSKSIEWRRKKKIVWTDDTTYSDNMYNWRKPFMHTRMVVCWWIPNI